MLEDNQVTPESEQHDPIVEKAMTQAALARSAAEAFIKLRPKKKDSKKEIELIDSVVNDYEVLFEKKELAIEVDDGSRVGSDRESSAPDKEIGLSNQSIGAAAL